MNPSNYLQFNLIGREQQVPKGGYLCFLPEEFQQGITNRLGCRLCELEHMLVVEIYGKVVDGQMHFELMPQDFVFWQFYQLFGESQLYMPNSLTLAENRCLPFSTNRKRIPVVVEEGQLNLICVGYRQCALRQLFQEYPATGNLLADGRYAERDDVLLPDVGINFRFREVLRQLSGLSFRPFHTRSELTLYFGRLFHELDAALQKEADAGGRSKLSTYYRAIQYIRENYTGDINKESIARALSVSPRTLNRAFENKNIKIADFIQRLKLNKAQELLYKGEMSIEEIANELQFPNRKYFSREFKKYFLDSPSSMRKS